MSASVFLDTNVLVYAAIGTGDDDWKRARSMQLIDTSNFGTSAQVLQEFYVNVVRKAQRPLSPAQAMIWLEQLIQFPVQSTDHQLVCIAIAWSQRYKISYWDAAILAAAEALGAHTVYSEDLSHGQKYGNVRVVNPYVP